MPAPLPAPEARSCPRAACSGDGQPKKRRRGGAAWCAAVCLALGCSPLPDASEPPEGERPCRTQEDCEIAGPETGPRAQICSSRGLSLTTQKDIAACGPMPNMTPAIHEPRLVCFRGSCVPVDGR